MIRIFFTQLLYFFGCLIFGCLLLLGGCKGKQGVSNRTGKAKIENYDPTKSRSSQAKRRKGTVTTSKRGGTVKKETAADGEVSEVIDNAKKYTGTPYKWGGTSRAGIDCSGLLFMSCQEADISVPRVSGDQANYGKDVSVKDLRPGDWVFFSARKGSNQITHAGLVTEVKSPQHIRFIHASTKLGVVESDFNASYYREIFVKAVRPF